VYRRRLGIKPRNLIEVDGSNLPGQPRPTGGIQLIPKPQ
jgi:hypothetical protein